MRIRWLAPRLDVLRHLVGRPAGVPSPRQRHRSLHLDEALGRCPALEGQVMVLQIPHGSFVKPPTAKNTSRRHHGHARTERRGCRAQEARDNREELRADGLPSRTSLSVRFRRKTARSCHTESRRAGRASSMSRGEGSRGSRGTRGRRCQGTRGTRRARAPRTEVASRAGTKMLLPHDLYSRSPSERQELRRSRRSIRHRRQSLRSPRSRCPQTLSSAFASGRHAWLCAGMMTEKSGMASAV